MMLLVDRKKSEILDGHNHHQTVVGYVIYNREENMLSLSNQKKTKKKII